ncbi:DUF1972 domain-containing protein [Flexivirga endophytica]|uniref:DUF1972 domain-containing protein n=1 Tax=Flexivirga endophytica TaxID=1849103 RepID=UPI00166701A7|nr:DUF1972 domain-containing protein [Flexivirga endophytica]
MVRVFERAAGEHDLKSHFSGECPRVAVIGTRGFPSYYGGFETLVRRLAPYLAERGWEVDVYSRPGHVVDEKIPPGVTQRFTHGVESTSASTLSYGLTACADAARRKPDVALVMNVANGYFLPLLKARGIPVVLNVDGLEWEREKWSTPAKRVFRAGATMSAKFADTLVADSLEIGRHWRENFQRDTTFIPYGGDVPDSPNAHRVRERLGLEPGSYVLAVARFVPENTMQEFFDAVRLMDSSIPVVVAGSASPDDPIQRAAAALAAKRSNVHLLGHLRDDELLHALWSNAGVYFHGHSVGGTNPALVQAMACGAPVVARDTVFNREVLGDAGAFTSVNARNISDRLTELLSDAGRRASLSSAARDRGDEHYSWEQVLGAYERCISEVAGSCLALSGRHGESR